MKGIGQNFNDFLKEQGIYDEVNELAAKKLITYQLEKVMQEQKLTISLSLEEPLPLPKF